jgi:hypothetical protein
MKKLLSLLSVFTLVACGGSDDDTNQERTTDPLIGTWDQVIFNTAYRIEYADDGQMYEIDEDGERTVIMGTTSQFLWSNQGATDLTSLEQYYMFEDDSRDDDDWFISCYVFSDDYNRFRFCECTEEDIRQSCNWVLRVVD